MPRPWLQRTLQTPLTATLAALLTIAAVMATTAQPQRAHAEDLWETLDEPYEVVYSGEYSNVLYEQHIETSHFYIEFSDAFFDDRYYADGDGNGVPNKFDDIAVALEMAWDALIKDGGMGYVSPLKYYGFHKVFVLIDNDERYINDSLWGYASVAQNDEDDWAFPYIILNGSYLYDLEEDWDEETETYYYESMISTAVHEFFHVVQFGYLPEFIYTYNDINFAEGSAEWFTDKIFPDQEGYQERLSYYLENTEYSLFGSEQPHAQFPYGTALWAKFIDEKFGDAIIREIFESYFSLAVDNEEWYGNMVDATEDALSTWARSSLADAYQEFTVWNYDMSRYEEGNDYPTVTVHETVSTFPYDRESATVEEYYTRPRLFGSNYVVFETAGKGDDLTVVFEGHEDARWSVTFLADNNGTVEELEQATLFVGEGTQTFTLDNAGEQEKIIMIVSVMGSNDAYDFALDNGYSYTFYASFIGEPESDGVSFESSYTDNESEDGFSDVPTSHANHRAITYLEEHGIVSGYDDGTFQPEKTLNRAELMKLLVTGQGLSPDPNTYKSCFNDVAEEWFAVHVCYAKEKGWVSGYDDGSFKPAQEVNKVEALKMLLEAHGMELPDTVTELPFTDTPTDSWYAGYLDLAHRLGILEESDGAFNPGGSKDRGSVSENLYRLIQINRLTLGNYNTSYDFELSDYFPTTDGFSWTYENQTDGTTSTVTNTNDGCDTEDCFIQQFSESENQFTNDGETIGLVEEITDYGVVSYSPYSLIFGNKNRTHYMKMEGDFNLSELGVKYTFHDGVTQFEIMDEDVEIETPLGTFETLKTKGSFLFNVTLTVSVEGQTSEYEGTMVVETVKYYAEGIGVVREETLTTSDFDDFPGLDGSSVENIQELVEYSAT